jgi:hypothetical protein
VKRSLFVLILVISLVVAAPAVAGAKTPSLKQLAKTVTKLQKKVNAQAKTIANQSAAISTLSGKLAADETTIASQGSTLASHSSTLAAAAPLLAIAPYVSLTSSTMNGVRGPNIVFQGANVHVRSTTAEDDASGLGNVIVGWNANPSSLPSPFRTGSNNLVVGEQNNFTSYGGFVAGLFNSVSGQYASVGGGLGNIATNHCASVGGGLSNTASGMSASVSGGFSNSATDAYASVSGGAINTASGISSSVSGGDRNVASGYAASVSGGGGASVAARLTASDDYGWKAGNSTTPGNGVAKYFAQ